VCITDVTAGLDEVGATAAVARLKLGRRLLRERFRGCLAARRTVSLSTLLFVLRMPSGSRHVVRLCLLSK